MGKPHKPGPEMAHREWLARLPAKPDGSTLKAVWEYEEANRRARMQARADKRAAEEAEERARAKREMERRLNNQRRNNADKRRRQREHREAKRFAKHMEEERIRQRMMAGDRWVAERMQKVTELEDLAEEMKELKAKERLMRCTRSWSVQEHRKQEMINENRLKQMERLAPLKTMGVDVTKLCTSERISPMLHRNEALANARQTIAQVDRQKMEVELRIAKEQKRLMDLSITRRTAEDRAENMWRIANAIPLSATMDSLKPGMLPGLQRPQSASDWMEDSQGMDGRMQAYQDAVAAEDWDTAETLKQEMEMEGALDLDAMEGQGAQTL